jgi:undecaprenyl-diphosphatase
VSRPSGVLVVAAAAGAGFLALAVLVVTRNEALAAVDAEGHERLREFGATRPTWRAVMSGVTQFGSTAVVGPLAGAAAGLLLWRGRRRDALVVAAAGVGAYVVSRVLRVLIGRARPVERIWEVDGASFPSGHAANAAAAATIVVLLAWPSLSAVGRILVVLVASGYAGAVAVSRVAGGVHWPSDVVGSVLLAVACVTAIAAAVSRTWRFGG